MIFPLLAIFIGRPLRLVNVVFQRNSQGLTDGGHQIFRRIRIALRLSFHPRFVFADGDSRLQTATSSHNAPAARPVVSTGVAVNPGSSSEFAHPQNDRAFQHAEPIEVLDQSTHGLIKYRQASILESIENVLMIIPAAEADFDKRNAHFDQTSGHQAAAAKIVAAVSFLNWFRARR